MSIKRPDFLEAYSAVEVPAPIISVQAHDPAVEATVEEFFKQIKNSLGLSYITLDNYFEQEVQVAAADKEGAAPESELLKDSVERFRLRGGQVIASVIRMSDTPESIRTRFLRHQLTDETYQVIHDFLYFERLPDNLD